MIYQKLNFFIRKTHYVPASFDSGRRVNKLSVKKKKNDSIFFVVVVRNLRVSNHERIDYKKCCFPLEIAKLGRIF